MAVLLLALATGLGCGSGGRSAGVDPASPLVLEGVIAGYDAAAAGGLSFAVVDRATGERVPVEGDFDAGSGAFRASVPFAAVHQLLGATRVDELARLGGAGGPFDPGAARNLSETPAGYVRLEVFSEPAAAAAAATTRKYAQLVVPVPRSQMFAVLPRVRVDGTGAGGAFALDEVGQVTVRVVDTDGAPRAGAMVAAVSVEGGRPLGIAEAPALAAVGVRSGEDGLAVAFPVRLGVEARYRVVGESVEGCVTALDEALVPAAGAGTASAEPVVAAIGACAEDAGASLAAAFAAGIKVLPWSFDPTGPARGHVNRSTLRLDLRAAGTALAPYVVLVFAGRTPGAPGEALATVTQSLFAGQVEVVLPSRVTDAGGAFALVVRPGSLDAPLGEDVVLYGVHSTALPRLDASGLAFRSAVGVEGIVSGLEGYDFALGYTGCAVGVELAATFDLSAALDTKKLVFKACDETGGSVRLSAAEARIAATGLGGPQDVAVFVRDAFGNVSADGGLGGANRLEVDVDFGVPDLEAGGSLLGGRLGISDADDTAGANGDAPWLIGQVRVRRSALSGQVLRFASEAVCALTTASAGDGGLVAGRRGHHVHDFGIGATAAAASAAAAAGALTRCGEGLPLASALVADHAASGGASFWLVVRDLAGHMSEPSEVLIAPCGGGGGAGICWQP